MHRKPRLTKISETRKLHEIMDNLPMKTILEGAAAAAWAKDECILSKKLVALYREVTKEERAEAARKQARAEAAIIRREDNAADYLLTQMKRRIDANNNTDDHLDRSDPDHPT